MAMTKTRYRWLALGAFLCLVATVTMCKWQDNAVSAQDPEKKEVDDREKKDVDKPASVADLSKPATISPKVAPAFAAPMPLPLPSAALPISIPEPPSGSETPAAVVPNVVSSIVIPSPPIMNAPPIPLSTPINAPPPSPVTGVIPVSDTAPPVPAPAGSVALPAPLLLVRSRAPKASRRWHRIRARSSPTTSSTMARRPGASRAGPSGLPIAATTSSSSTRTSRQTPI